MICIPAPFSSKKNLEVSSFNKNHSLKLSSRGLNEFSAPKKPTGISAPARPGIRLWNIILEEAKRISTFKDEEM